jgi:hypothetical protein
MTRRPIILLALVVLLALFMLRVHFWGGTVRSRYQVTTASASAAGADAEWHLTRAADPGQPSASTDADETWTLRDTGGDGTWAEFNTPQGSFTRPTASSPRRWLVICLDGVPLNVMQALWDSGEFREFFRPTAIVSTFPSDTETALTVALHAALVPGYEHGYFNRENNKISGGWWVTLSGYGIPYIHKLDYDPPGWAKALPYLAVQKSYNADVGRMRAAFLRSNQPVFLAHIAASDALMHVRTAEQARPLLLEFDDALRDLYLDAHGDLGILVFSDHGNTQTLSRPVPIEKFLADRGWRVSTSLRAPRDVAIPAYGLVGFAAIYCQPEMTDQLAEQLRGIEGADVIVSRDAAIGDKATIREAGSNAIAKLEWSADGQRYKYTPHDGDPLELMDIFNNLRAAGKLDAQGFAADSDLFAATSLAHYPDAAARIRLWATGGVRNRANIMVSLRPGYFHGSGAFNYLVTLDSTHGGLEQSATLGFAMATFPLPVATRVSDIIPARLLELDSAGRTN